jgi:hypothetical protein
MDMSCRALKAIDQVLAAIPVTANAVLDYLGERVGTDSYVGRFCGVGDLTSNGLHSLGNHYVSGEIARIQPITPQNCGE